MDEAERRLRILSGHFQIQASGAPHPDRDATSDTRAVRPLCRVLCLPATCGGPLSIQPHTPCNYRAPICSQDQLGPFAETRWPFPQAVEPLPAGGFGFDVAELQRLLDHDNWEHRKQMKAFAAADDIFVP
jgi:hypothetical protein